MRDGDTRSMVELRSARGGYLLCAGAVLALMAAACATQGARTFRFASNLQPAEGRGCVEAILRQHGFVFAPGSPGDTTMVATRAPVRTPQGSGEWWRVEVTVGKDEEGRTLITSVVGASEKESGPFTEPPVRLARLGSEITARCMWGGG